MASRMQSGSPSHSGRKHEEIGGCKQAGDIGPVAETFHAAAAGRLWIWPPPRPAARDHPQPAAGASLLRPGQRFDQQQVVLLLDKSARS